MNIPRLRFPKFKKSPVWEEKRLGEISAITAGQSPEGEYYNDIGKGLPFYQGKTDFGSVYINSPTKWTNQITKVAESGDLLMSVRAPVGALNIATRKICIGRGLCSIRPKTNKWFLYYYLLNNQKSIIGNGGSIFDSITNEQIKLLIIIIPSLPEQEKIAECLSSADEMINAQAQKINALKIHKKALLQNLFPTETETAPRLRFPKFKNAPAWEERGLGEVCLMRAGEFVTASEIKDKPCDNLYPCFGGNGLRGYTNSYTHNGSYSLIGRQGALCGNVHMANGKFHATEHAIVSSPLAMTNTKWLYYKLIELNLNKYATGQAQPGVSVENLKIVPVRIPKPPEQEKIAECLSSLDEIINLESQKLDLLKTHKKGLMQGLFPLSIN